MICGDLAVACLRPIRRQGPFPRDSSEPDRPKAVRAGAVAPRFAASAAYAPVSAFQIDKDT